MRILIGAAMVAGLWPGGAMSTQAAPSDDGKAGPPLCGTGDLIATVQAQPAACTRKC